MAQLVVRAAAAYVGFLIGGPKGAFIGWSLGGYLAPPTKIDGQKLDDLSAPKLAYGSPIPRLYGVQRASGVPIWSSVKHPHETTDSQGKGGGTEVTTTRYTVDVLFECAIDSNVTGFARVWVNKKLQYTVRQESSWLSRIANLIGRQWEAMTLFDGNPAQLPWSVYEAVEGVGTVPAYRHRTTIGVQGLDLGTSGQMPLVEFELFTAGTDTTGGYVDNFETGLTPWTGDVAFFAAGSSDFGPYLDGPDTTSTTGKIINKSVPSTPSAGFSIKFMVTGLAGTNDATVFILKQAGTQRFFIIPKRQTVFDALRRPFVMAGGETIALHSSQLTRFVWYRVDVELQAGAGNSRAKLYDAASGTLINTAAFAGNFSTFTVDTLEMQIGGDVSDPTSLGARYSNLVIPPVPALISTVDLADIVSAECARVGLGAGDIDVSDLAGTAVTGYGTAQAARPTLEQLAAIYYFEAALIDDKVAFVLRGAASAVTLAYTDTGAGLDEPADPFTGIDRRDDMAVPAFYALTAPDPTRDYETNTAISDRLVSASAELQQVQTNVVLSPSLAKGRADSFALDARVASQTGQVAVGVAQIRRTPTDVATLTDVAGTTFRARIVRSTFADQVFQWEVVLDDASVLLQTGIAAADGTPSVTLESDGPTVLDLIDGPILRDADDDAAGIYASAVISGPGAGSRIYKSNDDVTFSPVVDVNEDAVAGRALDALGTFLGGYVWDELNTVTVAVTEGGTLASSTRDAMQSDRTLNVGALQLASGEWEYFRWRTATLVATNQYTLSGLLRGLQGTEANIAGHAAGDRFVLLRMTGLRRLALQVGEIGIQRYWRGVTLGEAITSAASIPFTDRAIGKRPYSPTNLRATRDTSGNITFSWSRRTRLETRLGGSGGSLFPLGEASEAYEVDIYADGTYATLKRTLSTTTESVAYSSAQQTTDFGSNQATVYARVFQLSATVGRGTKLEAQA